LIPVGFNPDIDYLGFSSLGSTQEETKVDDYELKVLVP